MKPTPTCLGGSCPRFVCAFGTGRRWGSTTAPQHWRHEGAAGGPRFTSFRSATQHGPAQITGRRRERSKMCDGRRHWFAFSLASCVVRVGKRGLAGLWGHERGRVQAAPKHGVHGFAQRSNPYGKHPFQDVRRPAARCRADEAMATGNTAAPCWRSKARPRSRHRTAAPTGSPKNNRDQAIGRSAGSGAAPLGGCQWGCAGRPPL